MNKSIIIRVPSSTSRVVAVKPGKDFTVVAHGKNTTAVLSRARKAGVDQPSLMFVPKQGHRYIY